MSDIKHAGGRPLNFKTIEELQKKIDEYFEWCDNRTLRLYDEKNGTDKLVAHPAPYTMAGLARSLGISRQALKEYKDREKFGDAVKAARARVEEDVETRLMEKNATGAIFNLKNNFGWRDEEHHDITTGGVPFIITRGELKAIENK